MNSRTIRSMMGVCMLAVMGMVLVGCSSTPTMRAHDVTVALADDVQAGADTYTVYLVGVSSEENTFGKMQSTSVDDFIRRDDLRKLSPTVTFTMNVENSSPKTLAADAAIWNEWRQAGVMNLFVIADLPEAPADRSPMSDNRRVIIPLGSDRWDGQKKLKVTLRRSAIDYSPKPDPVKK